MQLFVFFQNKLADLAKPLYSTEQVMLMSLVTLNTSFPVTLYGLKLDSDTQLAFHSMDMLLMAPEILGLGKPP